MAQDPYGFPDAAPDTASDATQVLWLGVSAALLTAVGMCFCYVPYFIAAPLGLVAAYKAYQIVTGPSDARDRTMATVALVAGSVSGLVSAAFAVFILAYAVFLVVYMGVVAAAIGFGAAADEDYDAYDAYEEGNYEEAAPAEPAPPPDEW